jgi:hypothetical protein
MEDQGEAGDEHGDGGERGEILDDVKHDIVPCMFLCSFFVPFFNGRQASSVRSAQSAAVSTDSG